MSGYKETNLNNLNNYELLGGEDKEGVTAQNITEKIANFMMYPGAKKKVKFAVKEESKEPTEKFVPTGKTYLESFGLLYKAYV